MKNNKLKDDINFLEYPNWLITKRNASKTYTIEKENGRYVISTTEDIDRLPDRTDKIILYYLMTLLQHNDFQNRLIEISRYKIAKEALGGFRYDRIMIALRRWHKLSIDFNGIFYDGDGYSTRCFHVIDNIILKNNRLKIYFNIDFLEQIKNSQYFKLINFDEYKLLKRPTSARLYEILIKTFKERDEWLIGIIKLGEKLTLSEKYPSQILKKVTSAVNEINGNKEIELKVNFDYNKQTHICNFKKVKTTEGTNTQDTPQQTPDPQDDNLTALIQLLPKEHQDKKNDSWCP